MTTIPAPPAPLPTLLLTRPRMAANAFAEAVQPWAGPIVVSPVLDIVVTTDRPPDPLPASVIFTSQNAVRSYAGPGQGPAFCVGMATTQAAAARGFSATCVAEDARGLIAALPGLEIVHPLVHLRGTHVAQPVAAQLRAAGIACAEWVVYEQREVPLTPAARTALSQRSPVILPVFSPRSAEILCKNLTMSPPRAPCVFVAISQAVAAQIARDRPDAVILTAAEPNANAMVEAVHASARHAHALEGRPPLP